MAEQQAVNLPWRKPTWGFKSLRSSQFLYRCGLVFRALPCQGAIGGSNPSNGANFIVG